jgi:hypothetical protein
MREEKVYKNREKENEMTNYIINSAMIPGDGIYNYKRLDMIQFRNEIRKRQDDLISCIGYADTAVAIEDFTGVEIEVNRGKFSMNEGDEALVIKLKYRVPNPNQKGKFKPELEDYEFGLLKRECKIIKVFIGIHEYQNGNTLYTSRSVEDLYFQVWENYVEESWGFVSKNKEERKSILDELETYQEKVDAFFKLESMGDEHFTFEMEKLTI